MGASFITNFHIKIENSILELPISSFRITHSTFRTSHFGKWEPGWEHWEAPQDRAIPFNIHTPLWKRIIF
jgi:hypothetical protein